MTDWIRYPTPAHRCRDCGCWKTSRIIALPGEGNPQAALALVGEAPGANEEEQSRNFVGQAGQMLDSCIQEAGLLRSEMWVCNPVRCRPTKEVYGDRKNRTPTLDEIVACNGYLEDELLQVRPRAILCLGDVATKAVLHDLAPPGGVLNNLGKVIWSPRFSAWVILSVHPSYLLRRQAERESLTRCLIKASRYANGSIGEPAPVDYRTITTVGDAEALRDLIAHDAEELAFDWESNGIHLTKSIGSHLSLCYREREAYVIPRYHSKMLPYWSRADHHRIDAIMRDILLSRIPKIGSNVFFDVSISQTTLGIKPAEITFCCFIGNHLVNNHMGLRSHGLKIMADTYTDMGRYDDELDNWLVANGYVKDGKPDGEYIVFAPDPMLERYACADADATKRVKPIIEARIRAEGLWDLFVTERMPVAAEYQEMDRTGVRINVPWAHQVSGELQTALERTADTLRQWTPDQAEINPNSYPQVGALLFDHLGLPIVGRTETGAPSTREPDLLQIKDLHEAVPTVLQYRAYGKLKGYVDGKWGNKGILAVVDDDGYARMNTIIPGTETFRLVTRKPFPIHTWPKTAPHMPSVRRLIIPDDNYQIVGVDYDQQEWCLAAIASGQEDMIVALLDRREDIHEMVTRDLGGYTKAQFQNADHTWRDDDAQRAYKILRSRFKSLNFLILFRGGAAKLALNLGIEEAEAAQYISDYYERFDRIRWWQYETIMRLRTTGRSYSLFGTYRVIPGIFDGNKYTRFEAERQACNFPIQCSGAHVMFRAFLRIARRWKAARFPGRILFTMHDNITGQIRRDLVEEGAAQMREEMEQPYPELGGRSLHTSTDISDWWE